MNFDMSPARPRRSTPWTILLGSVSVSALVSAIPAFAADQAATVAQAPVEEVLVTGSLIRGAEAVGVPVTTLGTEDFQQTGAITVAELLKNVPALFIQASNTPAVQGCNQTRTATLDIHKLGGSRTLMLIDGYRYPLQKQIASGYDATIIPALAIERLDVLADGASATYGSDAVSGVVNVILRRGFDGAITQGRIGTAYKSDFNYQFAQLFGSTWDSGQVTLSYDVFETKGLDGSARDFFTTDFTPWGLDNQTPVRAAIPGIVSTGAPTAATGTGCTNCYSIPKGTGWDFGSRDPAPTLTWATLLANKGVANQMNPYSIAQATNHQQRNAATLTFDQEIYPGIEVFAEGFYSNRRVDLRAPANTTPYDSQTLVIVTVPTTNPYYPVGAPANIRVNYNFAAEITPRNVAYELSGRYAGGFNFDLPFDWQGKAFASVNQENNLFNESNSPNLNSFNAALGNTVASTPANGTTPGVAAFTKPANIPYLNLFCDPYAFQCNSRTTLDYVNAYGITQSTYIVHQYGANFDGPVFALPGGDVKAAVGITKSTDKYSFTTIRTRNSPSSAIVQIVPDYNSRSQWAVFGQVNIPVVSEMNAFALARRVDLEFSYRYDRYSDFGGTKNPKVAADWEPIAGLTLRGSWGTSFRAPQLQNVSPVAARSISGVNQLGGANNNTQPTCPAGATAPPAGTAGALLNPTCSQTAALLFPAGLSVQGGSNGLQGVTRAADYALQPEEGRNLSLGAEYAPPEGFLQGLYLSATWYRTKIESVITSQTLNQTGNALTNPSFQQTIIVRGQPGFDQALAGLLAMPQASNLPASAIPAINWIVDSSARNAGTLEQSGVDFEGRYDWTMGNWGDGNVGITGAYIDHQISQLPGGVPVDNYDTNGQPLAFKIRWRGNIGWRWEGFNSNFFVNYTSHVSSTNVFPPAAFLVNFPNFSNEVPAQFLFDLAVGYDTRDVPANEYLRNLNIQLVVNNIMNRDPPFAYGIQSSVAYLAPLYSPYGRTIAFTITKTW
jgi:iron complex outermembrane receptor protein